MAEELEVKLQVDSEEGKFKLDEFATKLAAVTAGVVAVQDALAGDPKKDATFGEPARKKVREYKRSVGEADEKVRKFRSRREKKVKDNTFGGEAAKEVNELSDAIDGVTQSTKEYIEIVESTEAGSTLFEKDILDSVEEMNTSIKELTTNTDEALQAMKDEGFTLDMEDVPDEIQTVNDKLTALDELVARTKERLATAQDNEAFGADVRDEIEQLEETLVNAEQAIADTKQKMAEGPKGPFPVKVTEQMKDLGGVFGDLLPRNIQQLQRGFKGATRGTQSFTKGLKGMRKALISTGIGALVVLLGELVANWEDIAGWMNSASEESQRQVEMGKEAVAMAAERSDYLDRSTNLMLLQGKTEEEIAAMKEKALDDEIMAAKINREAIKQQGEEQVKIIERNAKIAEAVVQALTSPIQLLLGLIDEISKGMASLGIIEEATTLRQDFNEMAVKGLGFDVEAMKEKAEEANKDAADALLKLEEERAKNIVKRQQEEAKEKERRLAEWEKHKADQKKFLDDLLLQEQEYGKSQDELAVMRLKREQEEQMTRAKELGLSNEELLRLEQQHARDLEDLENEQAARRKKIADDEKKRVDDALKSDLELRVEQVNAQYEELIKMAEKYGMDTVELEAKREAEVRAMRNKAHEDELSDVQELRRELELLNMDADAAEFASRRDSAKAEMESRLETAAGNQELEKMIREQFALEMQAIDNAERDNYVATRKEMFDSVMSFSNDLKGVYNNIQDLVRANMEAEMLAAKERGASDQELARLEAEHAEREKRFAITNVLLQQGQAIASAIAGAASASAATGPLAPFVLPAYIATAVGSIVAGFAQVKNILNKAKAQGLSNAQAAAGGGRPGATQPLTPNLVSDLGNEDVGQRSSQESFKTYVVASDVEGQNADYGNIVQNATL